MALFLAQNTGGANDREAKLATASGARAGMGLMVMGAAAHGVDQELARNRSAWARSTGPDTRRRGLIGCGIALSLGLHAASLACLLLLPPMPPQEDDAGTYSVVLLTTNPETATPTTPVEHSSTPSMERPQAAREEPQQGEQSVAPPTPVPVPDAPEPIPAAEAPPPPEQPAAPVVPPAGSPTHASSPHLPSARQRSPAGPPSARSEPPANPQGAIGKTPPEEITRAHSIWLTRVNEWLVAHRIYPKMARRLGRQGTVVVRFDVDRQGHVMNAGLVRGSGSDILDEAALTLVRNASLPPFPVEMNPTQQTITVPLHYQLD